MVYEKDKPWKLEPFTVHLIQLNSGSMNQLLPKKTLNWISDSRASLFLNFQITEKLIYLVEILWNDTWSH